MDLNIAKIFKDIKKTEIKAGAKYGKSGKGLWVMDGKFYYDKPKRKLTETEIF